MLLCVPVLDDHGVESRVSAHFGSAPAFMLVDTDTGATRLIVNANAHHAHGMCQPLSALAGEAVDGVVVGGIGMGALMKLQAAGILVYRAAHATVGDAVAAFKEGSLQPIAAHEACGHHGQQHRHQHGPDHA